MQTALNNFTKMGFKQTESALGNQKFWYNNKEYVCTPSIESRGQTANLGGAEVDILLSLHVRRDIFPAGVTVDSTLITIDSDLITVDRDNNPKQVRVGKVIDIPNTNEVASQNGFRNRRYRIVGCEIDPSGVFYKIDLADPDAG